MGTAVVSGIVGLLGVVIGIVGTRINASQERKAAHAEYDRRSRLEFRQKQLALLYGRLYQERRRSESLRDQLPQCESDGKTRWRLVHHLEEVKKDPIQAPIVERILDAGDRISELLLSNADLMEPFPPPSAVQKFIEHHELLRLSWQTGKDQDPQDSRPFPGGISSDPIEERCKRPGSADDDIDCAIYQAMETINKDRQQLLGLA